MKKKGFTLIEMMGVIVLLVLIIFIAFPAIIGVIQKSDSKIDSATESLIMNATKKYVEQNKNSFSLSSGVETKVYCVSIQQLMDDDFLIPNLQDASTQEIIDKNRGVEIVAKWKIVEEDGEEYKYIDYDYSVLEESCS